MITSSLSIRAAAALLGQVARACDNGVLATMEGSPIEGPGHGYLAMAFLDGPPASLGLFLAKAPLEPHACKPSKALSKNSKAKKDKKVFKRNLPRVFVSSTWH